MKISSYIVSTDNTELLVVTAATKNEWWKNKPITEVIGTMKRWKKRNKKNELHPNYPEIFLYIVGEQERLKNQGLLKSKEIYNPYTNKSTPIEDDEPKKEKEEPKPEPAKEKKDDAKTEDDKPKGEDGIPEAERKRGIGHFVERISLGAYNKVSDAIGKEVSDLGSTAHSINKYIHNEKLSESEAKTAKRVLHNIALAVSAAFVATGAMVFLGPLALVAVDAYMDYRQQVGANYGGDDSEDDEEPPKTTQEVLEEKEAERDEKEGMKINRNEEGKVVLADGTVLDLTDEQIEDDLKNLSADQLKEKYGESLTSPAIEEEKAAKRADEDIQQLQHQVEEPDAKTAHEYTFEREGKEPVKFFTTKDKMEGMWAGLADEEKQRLFGVTELPEPKVFEDKPEEKPEGETDKETEAKPEEEKPAEEVPTEVNPDEDAKKDKPKETSADENPIRSLIHGYVNWLAHQDPAKLKADLLERQKKKNPYAKGKEDGEDN